MQWRGVEVCVVKLVAYGEVLRKQGGKLCRIHSVMQDVYSVIAGDRTV